MSKELAYGSTEPIITTDKKVVTGDVVNTDNKAWVTVSRTISTRPYESFKIEMGYSQTLPEKMDEMNLIDFVSEMEKPLTSYVLKKGKRIQKLADEGKL